MEGTLDVLQILEDGAVFVRCLAAAIEECWSELGQEGGAQIAKEIREKRTAYELAKISDPFHQSLLFMALEYRGFRNMTREECGRAKTVWDLYEYICSVYN